LDPFFALLRQECIFFLTDSEAYSNGVAASVIDVVPAFVSECVAAKMASVFDFVIDIGLRSTPAR